jgi:hypothetical protein
VQSIVIKELMMKKNVMSFVLAAGFIVVGNAIAQPALQQKRYCEEITLVDYDDNECAKRCTLHQRTKKLRQFFSSYLTSLVTSGCIGAATGALVRYFEEHVPVNESLIGLLVACMVWSIEYELRNDVIAVVQRDFDEYDIAYKKNLMFNTAWIASWIAYLHR